MLYILELTWLKIPFVAICQNPVFKFVSARIPYLTAFQNLASLCQNHTDLCLSEPYIHSTDIILYFAIFAEGKPQVIQISARENPIPPCWTKFHILPSARTPCLPSHQNLLFVIIPETCVSLSEPYRSLPVRTVLPWLTKFHILPSARTP